MKSIWLRCSKMDVVWWFLRRTIVLYRGTTLPRADAQRRQSSGNWKNTLLNGGWYGMVVWYGTIPWCGKSAPDNTL